MAEEDDGANPEKEQRKSERKFSQEQYDLLKECSDKDDMSKWNRWRIDNSVKDVLLEKALFNMFYLIGVWLNKGKFVDEFVEKRFVTKCIYCVINKIKE